MTQQERDMLGSFIDEARHLTTNLNIFVSDMIREKDLVRQLDHEPDELAAQIPLQPRRDRRPARARYAQTLSPRPAPVSARPLRRHGRHSRILESAGRARQKRRNVNELPRGSKAQGFYFCPATCPSFSIARK